MGPSRRSAVVALAALVAAAAPAWGQPAPPRIGYVYPAGGRQGETFQVKVGGQYLAANATADLSGPGARVAVVEFATPLTQKEVNDLRERLQELLKARKVADILKEIADIRAKLLAFSRRPNPTIAETVTLEVTLAPDAAPGRRQLRLATPGGVTNPLVFCVDQLPEFREPERAGGDPPPTPGGPAFGRDLPPAPEPDAPIALPAVVNGRIMPGDVDRYRFQARKGQRLVAAASARALVPYLADAVPGWFQATMALYDAKASEVAYGDDYRFDPDPVLFYEVPADGEYVLEIRDAIYRGREDFVYRVAVGELPFVTGVFPLGGKAGQAIPVEVEGWNLPSPRLTQGPAEPGIHPLSVRRGDIVSNVRPFAVDTLPEGLDQEPNDAIAQAQAVTPPIIVNGRVDRPGDSDVFRFEGRAGQQVVVEVLARRLGSPLDSAIRLTDSGGRSLAFNDDCEDKGCGLLTHHADSWFRAVLPAAGAYYVHLGDVQKKGGREYAYRLRLGPPRPDFELRVAPSAVNARGGASVPLTVYALRKDGFAGEIALALKDAPAGFRLDGGRVPAGQREVRVTLTVPPTPFLRSGVAAATKDEALKGPLRLKVEGRATVGTAEVVRAAVPVEDMMQAFAYRHLVPAEDLRVALSGRPGGRPPVRVLSDLPVRIPAGGKARVKVGMPTNTVFGKIDFELSEPPDGIAIHDVASSGLLTDLVLGSDAAKAKPGLKGNLIVNVFVTRAAAPPAAPPPKSAPAPKTGPGRAANTAPPSAAPPKAAPAPAAPRPAPKATTAPAPKTAPPPRPAPTPAPPAAEATTPPPPTPPPPPRRTLVGTLPAIPFEIVPP